MWKPGVKEVQESQTQRLLPSEAELRAKTYRICCMEGLGKQIPAHGSFTQTNHAPGI